ncbi:MAG: hypothetical protein UX75_C0037G0009 [Candidatus Moranbacteria bacterium GW2011_GWE2_47_10]|nr:MAG: hypothetical protein UX75_C0037G0009 [Candidatus Moranbacteria bacterium GW2011_GWE2_47_10]
MEKSEKQKELEKWLNDEMYVQAKELEKIWKINRDVVNNRLKKNKIHPQKVISMASGQYVFYIRSECLKISSPQKTIAELSNNPFLISAQELHDLCFIDKVMVRLVLSAQRIKGVHTVYLGNRGRVVFYDRQAALAALADKLKPEYRHLIEKEPKPMQTADFIPADTLDIYNLDQLKAKIPGIEAHYEMFNKSEILEYQEIARMLRGNQKSVNLWGKMVEGIRKEVGAAVEVAPIENTNIEKESDSASLIKNNVKYRGCVISEESQKWLIDNGFLSVNHIKNICDYNRDAFDLFLCNSGVKSIDIFMPEMNRVEHFFYRDDLWKIHPIIKAYYQEFITNWYNANSDLLGPLTTSRAFSYMKNPAFVNNVYTRSFLHEEAVRRGDLIELDAYKGYFEAKKWSDGEKISTDECSVSEPNKLLNHKDMLLLLDRNMCSEREYGCVARFWGATSCSVASTNGDLPSRYIECGYRDGRQHNNAWKKIDVLKWARDNFHKYCDCETSNKLIVSIREQIKKTESELIVLKNMINKLELTEK